jgi:hypothetical protein
MRERNDRVCLIGSQENAEVLLAWLEKRLPAETALALERHASVCGDCRRMMEGQRAVWKALEDWDTEPVAADFDRKLYRAIEQEEARSWLKRLLDPVIRPVATFAMRPAVPLAATTLALGALLLFQAPAGLEMSGDPGRRVAMESPDAEQVESTLDDLEMLRMLDGQLVSDRAAAKSSL